MLPNFDWPLIVERQQRELETATLMGENGYPYTPDYSDDDRHNQIVYRDLGVACVGE